MFSEVNKRANLSDPFYEETYHRVYNLLYIPLCNYCNFLINNSEVAEDIVQDQFVNLWENWERFQKLDSLKSYLYASVKNRSINHLKLQAKTNNWNTIENIPEVLFDNKLPSAGQMLEYEELEKIVEKAIEQLPNKCRAIFILKRIDEMSNQEIAKQLNISIKTVEAQMTIALKRMYKFVSEHWELLVILCLFT